MRGDVRSLRAAQRLVAVADGPGCRLCGRADVGGGRILCGRCRREFQPTPLDLVLTTMGLSPRAFADMTGLSLRTVIRAAQGERLSKRVARQLAQLTGFPSETFRR